MKAKKSAAAGGEQAIRVRVAIVILLTLTLVSVLRWSMNVTKANARQISRNLSQIQQRLDTSGPQGAEPETVKSGDVTPGGLTIDPAPRRDR